MLSEVTFEKILYADLADKFEAAPELLWLDCLWSLLGTYMEMFGFVCHKSQYGSRAFGNIDPKNLLAMWVDTVNF